MVLRDGRPLFGSLRSCSSDQCRLGDRSVLRAEIAWIGFVVGAAPPPRARPVAEDELHTTDGAVQRGAFEGLSRGEVRFAGESLQRAAVRWIRIAAPGTGDDVGLAPIESDVLVRRDGAAKLGDLQGCDSAGCTMGGETSARPELAWIGLGVDPETPPPAPPADPTSPVRAVDHIRIADHAALVRTERDRRREG